jgi:large subunit ribosomal protein L9
LKVILTRDYEKLGSAGDMITVKDGFAKNFLLPNNVALAATPGNIRQMEIVKKSLIKKEAKNIAEAQQIMSLIDGLLLKFKVNSSPEGKLYGSITNKDLAEKIFDLKKVEVDRKKIDLEDHIKEVGIYDITVKLYKDVKAAIKVEVKSDDVIVESPEQEKTDNAESAAGAVSNENEDKSEEDDVSKDSENAEIAKDD